MENPGLNMSQKIISATPRLLARTRRGPIGLDLCLEHMQMIQLCMKDDRPHIHAATSIGYNTNRSDILSNPIEMKTLIKEALSGQPFKGRDCVATIPADYLKLKFITYTQASQQSDEEALSHALKDRLGDEINSSVIDYVPIRPEHKNQSSKSALVAIADRTHVLEYLNLLRHCGLKPSALEIGPVAVRRLVCSLNPENKEHKLLVINFGAEHSYMTVLWGRRILMDREVDFGLSTVINTLSIALDTEPQRAKALLAKYGVFQGDTGTLEGGYSSCEIIRSINDILNPLFKKLAAEIRDLLVYTASETRGGAIEEIYLFGSMARILGTDTLMDKLLSIPVKTINPFFGFARSDNVACTEELEPLAGIAVATGMALRGLSDDA